MKRLPLILALFACAAATRGGDAVAPAETPKPVSTYQLNTKSRFAVAESARAPFVPIGWVKSAGQTVVVQAANVDESAFRLTSILLGNPALAVINGRSYEEGQFLRLPRGSAQLRIRLYRITDGQVWLQYEDKLFAVQLKRPELGDRRSEQTLLLNEDRDVVPPAPPATPVPAPPVEAKAASR
ncbi:MAG: hypothetical protein ABMA13_09300 [Chthoniobacteraceae bacterium]